MRPLPARSYFSEERWSPESPLLAPLLCRNAERSSGCATRRSACLSRGAWAPLLLLETGTDLLSSRRLDGLQARVYTTVHHGIRGTLDGCGLSLGFGIYCVCTFSSGRRCTFPSRLQWDKLGKMKR
ncbi:hypothetical protein Z043_111084 [Scleropages formosus]|uniref:Uncharacterized protein n=1 Tax=Scleropages formosus TaxID=113540 RepID=A0A0P7V5T0_SCLFO|nr:hypothetical protein Z043_111084 [Scleropages formosus]